MTASNTNKSSENWSQIIAYLASTKRWSDIDFLTKNAASLGCKYCGSEVSHLLKMSVANWRSWGEALLIKMLENGVSPRSLVSGAPRHRDSPLHAALHIWSETGLYDFQC